MSLKKTSISSSSIILIVSNFFTIVIAVIQQWPIGAVMWIYFFQSTIIGVFNFAKMMSLQTFRTDGLLANGRPVTPNSARSRNQMAFFFLVHYGGFHLVYFFFLFVQHYQDFKLLWNDPFFLLAILTFLMNHFFSFINNYKKDIHRNLNLGTLLFFPYARVVPMHLMIMFANVIGQAALIYFMVLKSIADLITHKVEHSMGLPQTESSEKPQISP